MARLHAIARRSGGLVLVTILAASSLPTLAGSRDAARAAPDLDQIVHTITTVSEFADGTIHSNTGSGFIIGTSLFTVQHNLIAEAANAVRVTTYLDGVALASARTCADTDLAVFEVPTPLCGRVCNDLTLEHVPDLRRDQSIRWLRKVEGDRRWRSGRVLNYAMLGSARGAADGAAHPSCEQNLIVETDTPFISGSSGSPVVDEATGRIIGIIQGSLHRDGAPSGFFKPIDCVIRFAADAR